jgi:hypothetical protein
MVRRRAASTVRVTGLISAKVSTTPGIDSVGTKAEEANTSGKTQMKPNDWAASGLRTTMPTEALIQEKT